ncbi:MULTISPECIES: 3D domain-containing protein [Zobellia]|uniref:3D domain-containing protein n=1 Tax=Zobellia TaxID=112040 RepID=UPI001BFF2101|nr:MULTISPECIES: 3D domain-containing protein [Zobellia]MBT9189174.1 3D domain-containing protein [Zobellia russellii]MDO6820289.1 3D domain-containing protein [Zobellia sp. 1_MG-2023]
MFRKIIVLLLLLFLYQSCTEKENEYIWKTKEVHVSAYNSVHWQTDDQPSLAAWGDTLSPGMKAIAISKDLLDLGLERGTHVKIPGLEGVYVVMDKMNSRWKNKIDVYMGSDVDKARDWGKKKLKIRYRVKREADIKKE